MTEIDSLAHKMESFEGASAADTDSDDEVIVRRPNKKPITLLDDDDSDASDNEKDDGNEEKDDEDKNEDKDIGNEEKGGVEMDSDDNYAEEKESDGETNEKVATQPDSSSPDDKTKEVTNESESQGKSSVFDSDLFDADEESDSELTKREERNKANETDESEAENSDENVGNDDEGFAEESDDGEPVEMSAKLKARLKKGAAKKSKAGANREGAPRKSKSAVLELHSETQRIVRDSQVRLPYHQPEAKSIDDFLAQAREKRKLLRQVGGASAYRNLSWYEENERMKTARKAEAAARLNAAQTETTQEITNSSAKSDKNDTNNIKTSEPIEIDTNDRTVTSPPSERLLTTTEDMKQNINTVGDSATNIGKKTIIFDDDELPDLVVHTDAKNYETKENVSNSEVADNDVTSLFVTKKVLDDLADNDTDFSTEKVRLFLEETQSDEELESQISETDKGNSDVIDTDNSNINNTNIKDSVNNIICEDDDLPSDVYSTDKSHVLNTDKNKNAINNENNSKNKSDTIICANNTNNGADRTSTLATETLPNTTDTNTVTPTTITTPTSTKKSTFLTPKLASLAIPDLTPRLSGGENGFISFDSEEQTPEDPKIADLMKRYANHQRKRNVSGGKDVTISIVEKDSQDSNLKLNTITYHTSDTPAPVCGSQFRLDNLKTSLQAAMQVKREAARQKRVELYEMDNETGGFGEEEEEEEAEMTDGEDSDEEWNEDEEMEEEREEGNEYVDDEASDDENEDENDEKTGDKILDEGSNTGDTDRGDDDMKLQLDISDEEDINDADDEPVSLKKTKKKRALVLSDDDESNSQASDLPAIASADADNDSITDTLPDIESCDNKSVTEMETSRCESSLSEVSDITSRSFGELTPISRLFYSKAKTTSKVFKSVEKTPNFLNAEDSHSHHASSDLFDFAKPNSPDTGDNMDELLGLCSGKFVTQPTQSSTEDKKTKRSLFEEQSPSATQGMSELLGLCSGTFVTTADNSESQEAFDLSQKRHKRKLSEDTTDDAKDIAKYDIAGDMADDPEDDFDIMNPKETTTTSRIWKLDSDSDEEEGEEEDEGEAAKEELSFKAFGKKGKIRQAFVENEAELSGSEFGSDDEDDEEGVYEDILNTEEADRDVKLSEDQLRDQVGRVHNKQVLDEHERAMLRLQEMYLPDGDLHTEGGGRQRQFKWGNVDDNSQSDMFDPPSDDDEHPSVENQQEDSKWRLERYEREQWLAEQNKDQAADEDSQFVKFGQSFLSKASSGDIQKVHIDGDRGILMLVKMCVGEPLHLLWTPGLISLTHHHTYRRRTVSTKSGGKQDGLVEKTFALTYSKTLESKETRKWGKENDKKIISGKRTMKGSLLARGKDTLSLIAKKSKPSAPNNVSSKSAQNCVFLAKSPAAQGKQQKDVTKTTPKEHSEAPKAKKPRIFVNPNNPKESVFNHL